MKYIVVDSDLDIGRGYFRLLGRLEFQIIEASLLFKDIVWFDLRDSSSDLVLGSRAVLEEILDRDRDSGFLDQVPGIVVKLLNSSNTIFLGAF